MRKRNKKKKPDEKHAREHYKMYFNVEKKKIIISGQRGPATHYTFDLILLLLLLLFSLFIFRVYIVVTISADRAQITICIDDEKKNSIIIVFLTTTTTMCAVQLTYF